ncbi:MAG: MipA/OmpV family protein [Colwellia sp.]|nr:MipA/OmpV family protein [Colwellia sp.]
MKYFLLLLLLFSPFCFARDCEQVSDSCVAVGEWNFSLAAGAGVYTNPLHGGNNIPLVLIPKISYYGEQVFFENNTFGYTLFDNEHIVISAITQLNHEKAFFTRWHPQNIFIESVSSGMTTDISFSEENQKSEVNIQDVAKRRWAIDAGVQINWFVDQATDIQVQVLHDINNVYNGFNGQVQLSHMMGFKQLPDTAMSLSLGANINSKNLVDYYYGISRESDFSLGQTYQGKLSINPYFRLVLMHQISSLWSANLHLKRVFLDDNTIDSPLVKDNHIDTIFAGVTYDF